MSVMIRTVAGECFGTLVFMVTTLGAVIFSCNTVVIITNALEATSCRLFDPRVVLLTLTFAMVNLVSAGIRTQFSQGHLHPAVTIRLLVGRSMSFLKATCFILAQLTGAMVGIALVYTVNTLTYPRHSNGSPKLPAGNNSEGQWPNEFMWLCPLMTNAVQFTIGRDQNGQRRAESPTAAFLAAGSQVLIYHSICQAMRSCSLGPLEPFPPLEALHRPVFNWFPWVVPMVSFIFAGSILLLYKYQDVESLILDGDRGDIQATADMESSKQRLQRQIVMQQGGHQADNMLEDSFKGDLEHSETTTMSKEAAVHPCLQKGRPCSVPLPCQNAEWWATTGGLDSP